MFKILRALALSAATLAACSTAAFSQAIPTVGAITNTQIKARSITGLPAGTTLTRTGFAVAGDSPPVTYVLQTSACSLNSGAGDDGLQIKPNVGAGCWVANIGNEPLTPALWGANGVTNQDNTAAFTAMAAAYTRLGQQVYIPSGVYRIASKITFMPPAAASAALGPTPDIKCDLNAKIIATATMDAMFQIGSTAGDFSGIVRNGVLQGCQFEANNFADRGVWVPFVNKYTVRDTAVNNFNVSGVKFGSNSAPQRSFEGMFDNIKTFRSWKTITINSITNANPAVVTTTTPHGFTAGQVVATQNVGGMTQVNTPTSKTYYTVANPTTNSFQLLGVNSTGFSAYTSGGGVNSISPAGSSCIEYENIGDSHGFNSVLTGCLTGVAGNTGTSGGVYDSKFVGVHVWNYLENGMLDCGFDLAGSNSLIGAQVDGPFKYAFCFHNQANMITGSEVNYGAIVGVDNSASVVNLPSGASAVAVNNLWKADPSARLASEATGDPGAYEAKSNALFNVIVPAIGGASIASGSTPSSVTMAGTTLYLGPAGSSAGSQNAGWINGYLTCPVVGLLVNSTAAPGAGESYTFTLTVGGVDSAFTTSISGAASFGTPLLRPSSSLAIPYVSPLATFSIKAVGSAGAAAAQFRYSLYTRC